MRDWLAARWAQPAPIDTILNRNGGLGNLERWGAFSEVSLESTTPPGGICSRGGVAWTRALKFPGMHPSCDRGQRFKANR